MWSKLASCSLLVVGLFHYLYCSVWSEPRVWPENTDSLAVLYSDMDCLCKGRRSAVTHVNQQVTARIICCNLGFLLVLSNLVSCILWIKRFSKDKWIVALGLFSCVLYKFFVYCLIAWTSHVYNVGAVSGNKTIAVMAVWFLLKYIGGAYWQTF